MSMNGQAVDATLGANPLREGLAFQEAPPGHTLIIFGGSGDLAARKLIPALYNLERNALLSSSLAVVGLGRRPMDHQSYRARQHEATTRFSPHRHARHLNCGAPSSKASTTSAATSARTRATKSSSAN